MAVPSEELEVKTSTEAAQSFIDWFYAAVSDRKPLANYYVNSNAKYAQAGASADIAINGLRCATPADFETLLEKQGGAKVGANSSPSSTNGNNNNAASFAASRVRYDVDGFDVHVLNPQYRLACPEHIVGRLTPIQQQKAVSLLVQVTGHVQYGMAKDALRGAFTEVFVLVPNWDAITGGPKGPRGMRSHLIQSQNFRSL